MFRTALWTHLLRAGAFDALHGAHPGEPGLALSVVIRTPDKLQSALSNLGQTRATLLVSPSLAAFPELLGQATRAGHEIAGWGQPDNITGLEVAAGQPIRYWALGAKLNRANLSRLRDAGVQPLPAVGDNPQPGGIMRAEVAELPGLLSELAGQGYQPKPLRELNDLRSARPRDVFDYAYQRLVEDRYAAQENMIEPSQRYDAFMRLAPLDHAPDPLPLPRNAPTAELHLNSKRVVGLASKNLMATYRAHHRNFQNVARALQTHPELADAQAIFAVTVLYAPLEKAGFTLIDLPPLRARWYALGFRVLRLAYGTTTQQSETTPKMAYMLREEFLKKYG